MTQPRPPGRAGGTAEAPARVVATPAALAAVEALVAENGPVMFFMSGGCCDGSLPLCFAEGELVVGLHDVRLGEVAGCSFYIDGRQLAVWERTQLVLDVSEGEPEGFSLPAGGGHFVARARLFTPDEQERLAPPQRAS